MGIAYWIFDCHSSESSTVCFCAVFFKNLSHTSSSPSFSGFCPESLRGEKKAEKVAMEFLHSQLCQHVNFVSLQFIESTERLSLTFKSQPKQNMNEFNIGKNNCLVNKNSDGFNSTSRSSQEWMECCYLLLWNSVSELYPARFLILKKHKSKEIKDFANTAQVRLGPASLLRLQNFYEIT